MTNGIKPKNFIGSESIEIKYDKQFESTCLLLSQNMGVMEPRKMTVLQFYNALDVMKQQSENKLKQSKNPKQR